MEFAGKLNEEDMADVQKTARSKSYWPKLLLANWYGIGLFLMVTWGTISGLLGQTKPNWTAVAIIWAVIAAIVAWAVYRTKRARVRELTQLNADLPDHVYLTSDGLKWDGPDGATGFLPWRNFKGWREGKRVVLVDKIDGSRFVMLPVGHLSEIERLPIRQYLSSHISPSIR